MNQPIPIIRLPHVLVVHVEGDAQRLLGRQLLALGFVSRLASSASEAVRVLRRCRGEITAALVCGSTSGAADLVASLRSVEPTLPCLVFIGEPDATGRGTTRPPGLAQLAGALRGLR